MGQCRCAIPHVLCIAPVQRTQSNTQLTAMCTCSKQGINTIYMLYYTQVLHMHSVSLERCKAEGTSWDRKVKQDTWSQKCFITNSASLVRPRPNPSVPGLRSTSYLPVVHGLQDSLGDLPVPPPPMTPELEPMAGSSLALLTLPQLCSQAKQLLLCSPLWALSWGRICSNTFKQ